MTLGGAIFTRRTTGHWAVEGIAWLIEGRGNFGDSEVGTQGANRVVSAYDLIIFVVWERNGKRRENKTKFQISPL